MRRPSPEQPTAPYLDVVTAYRFRGSTRFHILGHKGGEGAALAPAADASFATVRALAERPGAAPA